MEKSVLDGCGVHSEKLVEISNLLVEKKIKNGEKVTKEDIWSIDSDIFEAYQIILSNAKDSNTISKAIQYFENAIENGGEINNLSSIANTVTLKSIEETQNYNSIEIQKENIEDITAAVVIVEAINNDKGLKMLDNLLDTEMLKDLESDIQKAKEGDIEAVASLESFEALTKQAASNPELDEKAQRGILARMMRLTAYDTPANRKLLTELAKQYEFDILDKAEDGNISINQEKLTDLYKEKMPATSKAVDYTIEDFRQMAERAAKKAISEEKYKDKTAVSISSGIKSDVKIKKIKKEIKKAMEKGDSSEQIEALCQEYPDEVKEILKEKVEVCNIIQETGKGRKVLPKVQQEIGVLSEAVKASKEIQKQDVEVEQGENYDAR